MQRKQIGFRPILQIFELENARIHQCAVRRLTYLRELWIIWLRLLTDRASRAVTRLLKGMAAGTGLFHLVHRDIIMEHVFTLTQRCIQFARG